MERLAMTRNGSIWMLTAALALFGGRLAGARAGLRSADSRADQAGGGPEQPAASAGDGSRARTTAGRWSP